MEPDTNTITVRRLLDEYECDECGYSFAEGAEVTLPDGRVVEFKPHAHCYDSEDFSDADIFQRVLETLGYTVKFVD